MLWFVLGFLAVSLYESMKMCLLLMLRVLPGYLTTEVMRPCLQLKTIS